MKLPDIFKVTKARWLNADGKRVKANSPGAAKTRVKSKDWYAEVPVVESVLERIARKDLKAEKAAFWLYKQRQETVSEHFNTRGFASSYKEISKVFGVAERTVMYWRKQGAPITPRGKTNLAEVSDWLNERISRSMGASTSNHYVTALRGFGSWLVKVAKVLDANPFELLSKVDARSDI